MRVGMAGTTADDGLPSPSKIKFMCSHGGKILPRPVDGQLKYVGGDTRVIAVRRGITFSELMKKLNSLFESDLILKYQLAPEDLDALVSVTCDDDLKHMMDEYDRCDTKPLGNTSAPRLRAFLFPSNPVVVDSHGSNSGDAGAVPEQRYIDAINGFVRSSSNVGRSIYCTEPISREIGGLETPPEPPGGRFRSMESRMGRVHSSPNLLSNPHQAALAPANHHPPPLQMRLGRPSVNLQLQTSRGCGGSSQMGRRYCVNGGYPGAVGNGVYMAYPSPHKETSGPYRTASSGAAEGEAHPTSPGQQQHNRQGPPMGQLRRE